MRLINKNSISTILTRTERTLDIPIPPVTILAYHAISHDKTIVDVEPEMFRAQLETLKRSCEFITLGQVINYIHGRETFSKPAVAVTFDDGYEDVFIHALPELQKAKIPAAIFVLSDPENANRQELENTKPLLSVKQLKILKSLNWTVGCHSKTHPNFKNPDLDMLKEIFEAKKELQKRLGFNIEYFVYPKGDYSPSIVESVKKAGYTAAFAFESGRISTKTNLFSIPRMAVDWTHTPEQFEAFFTNWGIRYLQAKQQIERRFQFA